jgi:hypothetical protein
LVDWVQTAGREVEGLELARDQTVYRGSVLTRVPAPFDLADLSGRLAEALGETCLSAEAQAVLMAAVRQTAG